MIFVTGSSGYVGSAFSPLIKKTDELIGIDLILSDQTDWVMDIARAIIMILDRLKSQEVSSRLYHFSSNFCCSWAEFSQAIFDGAAKLDVILRRPNVVAITTEEFPTPAKRRARLELSLNKIKSSFGIDPSACMLGIRSSLMAIKKGKY